MPDIDFFNFFRWLLAIIVTVYATVITLQSLWTSYVWLAGKDRYVSLVRRYLVVHGLRLRFKAFWGDVIISLLLCFVFLVIWRAHQIIYDIGELRGKPTASSHRPAGRALPATAGKTATESRRAVPAVPAVPALQKNYRL